MRPFYVMENCIQDYAWGDSRAIPEFLGIPWPEGRPAAELWMGSHPVAPSKIRIDAHSSAPLDEWLAAQPEAEGKSGRRERSQTLPFLFKLLAAGKPLSIQAHPDMETARKGFEREEKAGISRKAPERSYRDGNHKPELLMALSPFKAMMGFQSPARVGFLFSRLCASAGVSLVPASVLSALEAGESSALQPFLHSVLRAPARIVQRALETACSALWCESVNLAPAAAREIPRLAEGFPGDAGALAPLFLNVVELVPGEALFIPARVLHAYLEGFGVELMASSDNVLRGGLTSKKVDVDELLAVLDYREWPPGVLSPRLSGEGRRIFDTPAREFFLELLDAAPGCPLFLDGKNGPFILLTLEGRLTLSADSFSEELSAARGKSVFIPRQAGRVRVEGSGRGALAGCPS